MQKCYFNKKNILKNNYSKYTSLLTFITQNSISSDRLHQIGFEVFGPLLVGFCKWVNTQKNINNNDQIVFLARDGYIIQKIYNILYPDEKNSYMYVSRRSLVLPAISELNTIDEILDCVILPPMYSIYDLFDAMGLDNNLYINKCSGLKLDFTKKYKRSNLKNEGIVKKILSLVIDDVKIRAKEQYKLFNEYLKQINFGDNVGIIDIGWHNSIQKNLEKIVGSMIKINGYYIGVYDDAKDVRKGNSSNGYIFSKGNDLKKQFKSFSFVSLFELLFLSSESTTIGYTKKNNQIVPVFAKFDQDIDIRTKRIMSKIQDGAIDFAKMVFSSNVDIEMFTRDICVSPILEFGTNTNKKDILILQNINFENYGVRNIINFNHSSLYYLFHPKVAKNDFFQSGWRIMFLKKLIKIPLNYNYIFYIICKVFKRG